MSRGAKRAKAKEAHDTVLGAVLRAQADAAMIEAQAKVRLADEYDAAQERGEVATVGKPVIIPNGNNKATLPEMGFTAKALHEARALRDVERAEPGAIERALEERVEHAP